MNQEINQNESIESLQNINIDQNNLQSTKSHLSIFLFPFLVRMVLLAIGIGVFILFFKKNQTLFSPKDQTISASPLIQSELIKTTNPIVFERDNELFIFQAGKVEQLTHIGESVTNYDQDFNRHKVVYIVADKLVNDSGYVSFYGKQVVLLDLDSSEEKIIFTMKPEEVGTGDFVRQIRDVNFSDDGQLLAITTSEALYTYELTSEKLTEIFYLPVEEKPLKREIYAYLYPRFSPNNRYVSLALFYMEGGNFGVADLEKRQLQILDWPSGYGGSKRGIGWSDDSELLVFDNREENPNESLYPDLSKVSYPNLQEKIINEKLDLGMIENSLIDKENQQAIILSYHIDSERLDSGLSANLISRLDLNSGETTLIGNLSMQANEARQIVNKLLFVEDDRLFVTAHNQNNGSQIIKETPYSVDLKTGEFIPLISFE